MTVIKKILQNDAPILMGIVNATPDSFSDGGLYENAEKATAHALSLLKEGASIIDIGGESTRPGYDEVDEQEELSRVLPVIEKLKSNAIYISIDTQKASVARQAIEAGAHIINDISSLNDPYMAQTAAKLNCPIVLTANENHMGIITQEQDTVTAVKNNLQTLVKKAKKDGVRDENIILDIGLGFGKTPKQNLELLRRLGEFKDLGYPLLVGASRKGFVGKFSGEEDISSRLGGTIATTVIATMQGADIIRVHDVVENMQAIRMTKAILDA